MSTKNVIIIGASNAGRNVVTNLLPTLPASHRILLIDPSPIAFWPPASLRASVVKGWEKKVYKVLTKENLFGTTGKGELIRAKVEKLGDGWVELDREWEGSTRISFEALAIATGASQIFPMRPPTSSTANDIENSFIAMQIAIASSNKIVVVGGGPTGIEFAGEVISEHPTKQVTLIHKNASLLDERFPAKLGRNLISLLEKKGVKLVLGERLDGGDVVVGEQGGVKTYTTDKGTKVEADYVFLAKGNTPNTQLMEDLDAAALTDGNLIKVNEYLQVQSTSFPSHNVFALGDCADSPGWRTLITAEADSHTVAANILATLADTSSFKKHKPGMRAMVVPIGPSTGSGFIGVPVLGDVSMFGFMVAGAKGKTLFTERFEGMFVKA